MKLSVIYVNYNTDKLLQASLRSLVQNLKLPRRQYEVIVIDNASRNFHPDRIRMLYPTAIIQEESKNHGFGGGNNLGVKQAKGEYIWLLNTDTLIPVNNNIEKILEFLDTNSDYAAASPLLTGSDQEVQPAQVDKLPTLSGLVFGKAFQKIGITFGKPDPQKNSQSSEDHDVELAVAAALIFRKSSYAKLGGFDERYFMYYEDTDLCRAVHEEGWKIRWMVSAHIVHLWGKSLQSSAQRKQYYYQSQSKYFAKWEPGWKGILLRVARLPKLIKNVYLTGLHEKKHS